jgi:hypothetical protein
MLRLTQVDVVGEDGLKGQCFREHLTGCDVFVGPNGAGKSTRLLAIQAALQGLAETPADTQRVYLGPVLPNATVELLFERDGEQVAFTRDLHLTQATKEAKVRTAQAADLVGANPTRWDLDDFARGTDTTRRQVLDAVCRASGALGAWSGLRVREELQAKEEAAEATGRLLELLPLADVDDLGRWVPAALQWTRDEYTRTNAAQKQAEGHMKEMAKREQAAGPDGTLEEARAELERAEFARREAAAQVAAATAQARLVAAHASEGDRHRADVARAKAEATSAAERLAKAREAAPIEDRTGEARAKRDEARRKLDAAKAGVTVARQKVEDARRVEANARGYVDTVRRLLTSTSNAGAACCVHCGAEDPLNLQAGLQAAEDAAAKAKAQVDDVLAGLKTTEFRERQALVLHEAASAELTAATTILAARVDVGQVEEAYRRASAYLEEAERRFATWAATEAPAAPAVGAVDLAPLDAALQAAKARVEAHVRHEALVAQAARAEGDYKAARSTWDAVRALGEELKRIQGEVAQAAYAPICEAAGTLLQRAGLDWRVEIRSESDLGAVIGGVYRPLWSLSDSERAVVGMGLALAFARLSGLPWRAAIIDRLEALDQDRLPRILRAVAELVAEGWIDNFAGALVGDGPAVQGCAMHSVYNSQAQEAA